MPGEFDRSDVQKSGAAGDAGRDSNDAPPQDLAGVDDAGGLEHLDAVAGSEFVDDRLRLQD